MQTEFYFPFTSDCIKENVAELQGVYTLYNADKITIYHGKAQKQNLQRRLLQHLSSEDRLLNATCYFSFEVNKNPEKKLRQLISDFQAINGKMPECNEKLERIAAKTFTHSSFFGRLTTAFLP